MGSKQKRGHLLVKLREDPHNPPFPSMFLTNAGSLTYKMDELEILMEGNRYIRDCCFNNVRNLAALADSDVAVQLAGHTLNCLDCNKDSCKARGV